MYTEGWGRPSVDPELALRMMLLGYLFNLSDHKLCEEVRMHAGFRWFSRLEFHDPVPDWTTLVKLRRERWGKDGVFDDLMREVDMEPAALPDAKEEAPRGAGPKPNQDAAEVGPAI